MKGLLHKDSATDALAVRPLGSEMDSDLALPLHYDDCDRYDHFKGEIEVDYTIVTETRLWGTKCYAKLDPNIKLGNTEPKQKIEKL